MRTVVSTAALVIAVCAPACDKGSSSGASSAPSAPASVSAAPPPPPAPPPAASSSAQSPGPGRGPGHGGVDRMFFRAAKDLGLDADVQGKIDELKENLRDRDTAPRDALRAFRKDLASGARAGKLDTAKLKFDEADIDKSMDIMRDKQAKALDGLHAILDGSKRQAIADAMRARWAAHDAGGDSDAGADAGAPDWAKDRVDRMTADLGLDAAQQAQLRTLVAQQKSAAALKTVHDITRTQMEALLKAFVADGFVASKALPVALGAKTPHDAADRRVALVNGLLALLHPDQRDKLATQIEKGSVPRTYAPLEDQDEALDAPEGKSGE